MEFSIKFYLNNLKQIKNNIYMFHNYKNKNASVPKSSHSRSKSLVNLSLKIDNKNLQRPIYSDENSVIFLNDILNEKTISKVLLQDQKDRKEPYDGLKKLTQYSDLLSRIKIKINFTQRTLLPENTILQATSLKKGNKSPSLHTRHPSANMKWTSQSYAHIGKGKTRPHSHSLLLNSKNSAAFSGPLAKQQYYDIAENMLENSRSEVKKYGEYELPVLEQLEEENSLLSSNQNPLNSNSNTNTQYKQQDSLDNHIYLIKFNQFPNNHNFKSNHNNTLNMKISFLQIMKLLFSLLQKNLSLNFPFIETILFQQATPQSYHNHTISQLGKKNTLLYHWYYSNQNGSIEKMPANFNTVDDVIAAISSRFKFINNLNRYNMFTDTTSDRINYL